ncbi:MAG TPA: efflux RND transporter permease subunit [Candidatus Limnocylindria bacterium]|nr:efflux RND transporter permease subunit [Candidatus Limnocylindria bacterium]
MTWLTRAAVDRRSVTLLIAAALFAFGIASWGSLKQELLPDVSFPVATVIAPFPGASADDVADQVVAPIERAVQSVAGIDQVRSTSANSIGFITAQFEYGTDVDEATAAMEEAIAALTLPESVDPNVSALNINASPVVIAAISSQTATLSELGDIAANEIVPELEGISGVADVEITGGLDDEVTITLDPAALAQSGVAYAQIQAALAASGVTVPAGELPSADQSIPVTVIGEITSPEELEAIVVGLNQASGTPVPVTLGDLATVEEAERATTGYARINGSEALSLTVSKIASANTVEVSEAVNAALDEILAQTDGDLDILRVSDQSDFIIESRDGLLREGGLGAVFAVLTIFAFLGSLRSTFVAAMSIPLSLLVALVLMQVTGITMNIMTLGGLAVAVGRVVDDSIVVLENIYRHRAMGEDRKTAVLRGPAEVAGAITWSTLTTVAVFLPLGFAGGLISQFFLPFALTVTFALLASLLVALTVVPVLGYFLVRRPSGAMDEAGEPRRSIWVRLYDPTIRAVLRSRWTSLATVLGALALFVGSLFLVPLLPTAFINSGSEKILVVSVSPPPGATSEAVRDVAAEAEAIILTDDEVELVQTSVPPEGDTGFRTLISAQAGRAANSATMFVRLGQESDLPEAARRLEESLGAIETDGWGAVVQQNTGPAAGGNLAVVVGGPDADAVETGTETVVDAIGDIDGLANVTSDLVAAAPTVEVRVDADRAAAAGVTAGQVGGVVRAALTSTSVTTIQPEGAGEPVTVLLRFDPAAIDSPQALAAVPVGPGVTLGDVADIHEVEVRATISRVNATPSATVSAEITSDDTGGVSAAVSAELERLESADELPSGVTVAIGGVSEQQAEAFGGLFTAMAVAILLVYLMLALAFGSLVTPFVILFSLPLATIGAFPALLITGRPIGISALIGFLMLIGIVVTNAIVLLDLVERLRAEGVPLKEALIRGGHTRVRPILMTAIATILALVPLAAGFNEGSIIAAELGTVVIGGLLSSTFLTLIVVPAAYRLVEGLRNRDRLPEEAVVSAPAALEG